MKRTWQRRGYPSKIAKLVSEKEHDEGEPYPNHLHPTHDECLAVRDALLSLHGFPPEFAEYRRLRQVPKNNIDDSTSCSDKESVLDGLIKTVLSQNTTEANSMKAYTNLKIAFPTWNEVVAAESKLVEDAIRCGGLAPTKASCIKSILTFLQKRKGKLCMEYLRDMSIGEIRAELSQFKGIGPKTVSCVLLFNLQHDDLPVDTHVFRIAKAVGWVPLTANRNKTYAHLNHRIPDELKFDLNCLLYTHGKLCKSCTTGNGRPNKQHDSACPLFQMRTS